MLKEGERGSERGNERKLKTTEEGALYQVSNLCKNFLG